MDTQWCTEALQECWDNQWTVRECAEHIGVSKAQMYDILLGHSWVLVPRPAGWVYPFPRVAEAKAKRRTIQREKQAYYLNEYVRKRMGLTTFARTVGVARFTAWTILSGKKWKSVERPEGFQYPWPGAEETNP